MKHIFQSIKYITAVAILISISSMSFSQTNEPYEMMVNGVKLIVQPSGNDIVVIQTIIKGGVQNYAANKAGIESVAMNALTECGTAKDDKNSFKNKLDKVSAQVYGGTGMDYATFTMNCIKSDIDVVWPLYVDALTTPKFDEKEFTRLKQDAINSLKSQESEPDYAISKLAKQTAFADKDYAKSPEGTEATLTELTADETKSYYQSILEKSRMVIVVVGDIEKNVIEEKIKNMLADVPAGKPFMLKKEMYVPKQATFKAEKKDLATNYIQAVTGAPEPGTPDFNAFTLGMRIFSNRNFLEVRSKNGLSYAPSSYFDGGLSPSSNIFVSTTEPNKYISVITSVVDKIKKDGFTEDEVKNMKTTYVTRFFYGQETNSAQASSLASNEVLHDNWRRSLTLNEDLKKVTVADVNNAFNKYVTNLTWVYQGDPAKVNAALYTQTTQPKPKSTLANPKIN